jgi:hypothetical protein
MSNLTRAPELCYLRTKEAAHLLSLSARTLEKYRTHRIDSLYRKIRGA